MSRFKRHNGYNSSKRVNDWKSNNSHLFQEKLLGRYQQSIYNLYRNLNYYLKLSIKENRGIKIREYWFDSSTKNASIVFALSKLVNKINISIGKASRNSNMRPMILRSIRHIPNGNVGIYFVIISGIDDHFDDTIDTAFDNWAGTRLMEQNKLPLISYTGETLYENDVVSNVDFRDNGYCKEYDVFGRVLSRYFDNDSLLRDRDGCLGLELFQLLHHSPGGYLIHYTRYIRKPK